MSPWVQSEALVLFWSGMLGPLEHRDPAQIPYPKVCLGHPATNTVWTVLDGITFRKLKLIYCVSIQFFFFTLECYLENSKKKQVKKDPRHYQIVCCSFTHLSSSTNTQPGSYTISRYTVTQMNSALGRPCDDATTFYGDGTKREAQENRVWETCNMTSYPVIVMVHRQKTLYRTISDSSTSAS